MKNVSINHQPSFSAKSSITGLNEFVYSTNHALDVNASVSISGSPIPVSGATTAIATAIVDGSGNQITSFGGGTQYADGVVRGTATGTLAMIDDGSNIQSAKGDTDGTQQINATKIVGTAIDVNSGTKSAGTQRVVLATDQPQLTNALKVDGTGGTFPISGTVAATQSGTWTVQPGNTANTTAWLVTGTGGTFPITDSGGSITVDQPTGSNLHTVLDSGTLTTLTGTTSLTPGTAAANLGKAEDAGHSTGDVGVMFLGVRNDVGTALATTTLDYIPMTTDEVGATWMATIGRVSTNNSSTATLLSGAVFTGTSDEVKNYAAIQISVISNVASATDGLSLQQSSDGTNWDITDVYTVAAATGKVFSVQPAARFFRIVYTNGGTNQASFRLQTVYHTEAPNPSSQRTADAYTNETDLTQQWTFNSLFNGTTWDRMRGDITNGLDVDITRSIPGTGATNLGKAEDAAHTTGDTGVFFLGVRNDGANTAFTNTNGDYNPVGTDSQGRVYVVQKGPTATLANVAGSATSVTLLAANDARIGAQITNDSSALLYIKFGTTASTTSYTVVLAGAASAPFSYYEIPAGYTGRIDGIWASATGNARVTEIT